MTGPTDTSYHRMPDAAPPPPPPGCPVDHHFSPFDPDYLRDPYPILAEARHARPVFYAEAIGHLVVTRMDDVAEVFLDPVTFSSENVQDPVFAVGPDAAEVLAAPDFDPVAVMSNRQEPDHGRIRNHTKKGFSNRRLRLLEPYIRRRANELVDSMVAEGSPVDFVTAFGHPLPGETIFRFIGFPTRDDARLQEWCCDRLAFSWGRPSAQEQTEIAAKMLAYWRYCRDFVADKHVEPGDDFTSELLAAHDADPDDLTYREVESIVYGLSFAGHEIVTNFLSNALLCLLGDRPSWDALCADRALVAGAVEEVLRFESPQTSWRRVATVDTSIGGVDVPAGTRIMLSLAAANHSPEEFADPTSFDIRRPNARNHISFGKGIHFCLGARLARLEANVVLEVLTERLPSLDLVAGQGFERFPNFTFRGPQELLVCW